MLSKLLGGVRGGAPSIRSLLPFRPRTREAFCFGPAQCPSRSAAEAAVPPACPRRGKRERGRIRYLAAAGCFLMLLIALSPCPPPIGPPHPSARPSGDHSESTPFHSDAGESSPCSQPAYYETCSSPTARFDLAPLPCFLGLPPPRAAH